MARSLAKLGRVLAPCLILLAGMLSPEETQALLAVDGINGPYKTLAPEAAGKLLPSNTTGYLAGGLRAEGLRDFAGASSSVSPAGIRSFIWSGDATKTDKKVIDDLKAAIIMEHDYVQSTNKRRGTETTPEKVVIVAHSWGTVLAYAALTQLAQEHAQDPKRPDVKVDSFITLGSPLHYLDSNAQESVPTSSMARTMIPEDQRGLAREFLGANTIKDAQSVQPVGPITQPANVTNWTNIYAPTDPVSGFIPALGANNKNVDPEGALAGHPVIAHKAYFEAPKEVDRSTQITNPLYAQDQKKTRADAEQIMKGVTTQINSSMSGVPVPTTSASALSGGSLSAGAAEKVKANMAQTFQARALRVTTPLPIRAATNPATTQSPTIQGTTQTGRIASTSLTPVSVTFTQAFDGLFTQSADSPGSLGGDHSGTFTSGTRTGAGSRPGTWTTGSFSGRTVAEPGFTPNTFNNAAFSGTSVGTATARGYQQGDLKGSMTVTVPAGTQTATVSGKITINTNGSLSMPSYSGPVTVNATGAKVGAMAGSWNQGPTK